MQQTTLIVLMVALLFPGESRSAEHKLAQPFGITMGQKPSTLTRAKSDGDNIFNLPSVPRPHPLLSRYTVSATEKSGVCKVTGYAPAAEPEKIDRVLKTIQHQITELLGDPRFLPGNRDRTSTGIWLWGPVEAKLGAPPSPLNVVALYRYEGGGRSAAMLQFEFTNHLECEPPPPPNPFR